MDLLYMRWAIRKGMQNERALRPYPEASRYRFLPTRNCPNFANPGGK